MNKNFRIQVLPSPTVKPLPQAKNTAKFADPARIRSLARRVVLAGLLARRSANDDHQVQALAHFASYKFNLALLRSLDDRCAKSASLVLDNLLTMCLADYGLFDAVNQEWVDGWLVMLLDPNF
jgi:hypothetical protein